MPDALTESIGDLMAAVAGAPATAAGAASVVAAATAAAAAANAALAAPAVVSLGCAALLAAFGAAVGDAPLLAAFAGEVAAAEAATDPERRERITDGAMVLFSVMSAVAGGGGGRPSPSLISEPLRALLRRAARAEGGVSGRFVNAAREAVVAARTPWRSAAAAAAAALGIAATHPAAAARVAMTATIGPPAVGAPASALAGGPLAVTDALADVPVEIGLVWAVATAIAAPERADVWAWAAAVPPSPQPAPADPSVVWCRLTAALALARAGRSGSAAEHLRAAARDIASSIRAAAPPRIFLPPIIL